MIDGVEVSRTPIQKNGRYSIPIQVPNRGAYAASFVPYINGYKGLVYGKYIYADVKPSILAKGFANRYRQQRYG